MCVCLFLISVKANRDESGTVDVRKAAAEAQVGFVCVLTTGGVTIT